MRKWAFAVLAALIGTALSPAYAERVTLTGEVTYRERIGLPENASLRIRLVDLTAAGSPARVEAQAAIGSPGQVPLSFTLNFDDRAIDPAHRHAIIAEITSGTELWFRNTVPYAIDPLAPAAPVQVIVDLVGGAAVPAPLPTASAPLPAGNVDPSSILDVTWRADVIAGKPTDSSVDSTLTIGNDMRVGGRGGCNSYFAQAALDAEAVAFSAIAATKLACLSDIATAQEQAFFDALAAARFWRSDGSTLVLLDAAGVQVVRFVRVAR